MTESMKRERGRRRLVERHYRPHSYVAMGLVLLFAGAVSIWPSVAALVHGTVTAEVVAIESNGPTPVQAVLSFEVAGRERIARPEGMTGRGMTVGQEIDVYYPGADVERARPVERNQALRGVGVLVAGASSVVWAVRQLRARSATQRLAERQLLAPHDSDAPDPWAHLG